MARHQKMEGILNGPDDQVVQVGFTLNGPAMEKPEEKGSDHHKARLQ